MCREWNLSNFAASLIATLLFTVIGSHERLIASDGPVGIAIHKVSTYRADLYWFCDNVNDSIASHNDGGWNAAVAVHSSDLNNRIAVKFDGFSNPVYIQSGAVFILDYNDPSVPGDPTSPLEVSLRFDNAGLPGELAAGPVVIAADGDWLGGGEWVSADLNYLHDSSEPVWLQVKWPSANPFMPKLGGDSGPQTHYSYFGYEVDGNDVWQPYPGYEVMIRLYILNNTKDSPVIESDSPLDSFTIYSRDRLPLYPDQSFKDTSACGWSLNQRVQTGDMDNYYCVTAWSEGVESSPSEIVHAIGGSGGAAPVSISPRHVELTVPAGSDTVAYMTLENRGYATLQYEYSDYYGMQKPAIGFPMTILNGAGVIYPGRTDTIVFMIGSSALEEGDYMEVGYIGFSDSLEVYAAEDVSIYLVVDQLTSVEEVASSVPHNFILEQNFPNPFNGETTVMLRSDLKITSPLLIVSDLLGRKVAEIAPSANIEGSIRFQWDGRDESGCAVTSGVYFYRLKGYGGEWKKMAVIR